MNHGNQDLLVVYSQKKKVAALSLVCLQVVHTYWAWGHKTVEGVQSVAEEKEQVGGCLEHS